MPKKNKQSSTASNLISTIKGGDDDDASSMSSVSTMGTMGTTGTTGTESSMRNLMVKDHRKSGSALSLGRSSPRSSVDGRSVDGRQSVPGTPKLGPEVRSS